MILQLVCSWLVLTDGNGNTIQNQLKNLYSTVFILPLGCILLSLQSAVWVLHHIGPVGRG